MPTCRSPIYFSSHFARISVNFLAPASLWLHQAGLALLRRLHLCVAVCAARADGYIRRARAFSDNLPAISGAVFALPARTSYIQWVARSRRSTGYI
jgi:hypothetical protein